MRLSESNHPRIFYLDNLRVFLTILVVLHHWAIANGAPGDWYLVDNHLNGFQYNLMSVFVAINQSFFMGLFFFISAYFVPSSLERKGELSFVLDRLRRLGIPFLFYLLFISPIQQYAIHFFRNENPESLVQFIKHSDKAFSCGPLWFVELLFVFNVLYIIHERIRKIFPRKNRIRFTLKVGIPFALGVLILGTFLIRVRFPVGVWMDYIAFQPAHVLQYLMFFTLGVQAKKNNWLERLLIRKKQLLVLLIPLVMLLCLPFILDLLRLPFDISLLMGGYNLQSFVFVAWEQFMAVVMILFLLVVFKRYLNKQFPFLIVLSQNAYGVFILHSPVLILFSLIFGTFVKMPLLKYSILLPAILLFCFLLSIFLRRITWVKKVI